MAWNAPGNKGSKKENDPWGNKKNQDQGPPDLDEIFSDLLKKINSKLGKNKGGNQQSNIPGKKAGLFGLGFIALVAIGVWVASGFYTIGEAQRGVVLRFGAYNRIVDPGLNWKATFIDKVIPINMQAIRSLRATGLMLTKEENVVNIEMDVQYRIYDPKAYLFSVVNAEDSLRQATDSALRAVIGDSTMNAALTKGRQLIRDNTEKEINKIIQTYNMGIEIVDVNFLPARPPEAVKDSFDDAISAREDQERFIREAEAYSNDILPKAKGQAAKVMKAAEAYKEQVVNAAEGQVAQFNKLLPEYLAAKEVTRSRLYIETMEKIYTSTSKVLIDNKSKSNLLYLPLDKMIPQARAVGANTATEDTSTEDNNSYGIQLESPSIKQDSGSIRQSSRQGRY